jgi:N-acetylmuramoyl-L-alanine amidase
VFSPFNINDGCRVIIPRCVCSKRPAMLRFHESVAWALLVLALSAPAFAGAAHVEGVRIWPAPDYTRLVFDLSGPVTHKIIRLQNPERLVIDIPDATLKAVLPRENLDNTGIRRLRSGVRDGDDLRIVLDLQQHLQPRSFLLAADAGKKDRLVLDLYRQKRAARVLVAPPVASGNRDIVVAIDAGHGGEDPGALGPGKLREKDVALAISRELARRLQKAPGYRPVLVRKGDYFIPLKQRRKIARDQHADLFVSIHADAFHKKHVRGGSVFALSQLGATSETASFVAASENQSDRIGGVKLLNKDEILAEVLYDLSMTANLDDSLSVGGQVLRSMGSVAKLHKPNVEQANFVVLRSADIPSILVETGFISNPEEARRLASRSHQGKLAGAIFTGVKRYFESSPPKGTLVASRHQGKSRDARLHVVDRGDTLSQIAQRYQVSVVSIRRSNGLTSNSIRIGQKLRIPTT